MTTSMKFLFRRGRSARCADRSRYVDPALGPSGRAPRQLRLRHRRPAAPIDTGDTAWMLTSTALVLMMTIPGLALFYGGMVRKKNVLATVMQSFAITCLVTVLWMVVGYSLAFTDGGGMQTISSAASSSSCSTA